MQGLSRKEQLAFKGRRPTCFDEFKITKGIGTVNFVADDRKSEMVEVNPELVQAARVSDKAEQGKTGGAMFDPILSTGRMASRHDGLAQVDRIVRPEAKAGQRSLDDSVIVGRPTPNNRPIGLLDLAPLRHFTEFRAGIPVERRHHQTRGFAIQSIDKGRRRFGKLLAQHVQQGAFSRGAGGMAKQVRRFIDYDEWSFRRAGKDQRQRSLNRHRDKSRPGNDPSLERGPK